MSIVALGPSTCASVKHIVSIRCSMGLSRTRYARDERASAWVPNPCLPRSLDYSLLGRVGEHPLPRLTLRSAPPVRCPRCGAGQCQWGSDPGPAAALTVRCGACLAPLRLRLDWADSVARLPGVSSPTWSTPTTSTPCVPAGAIKRAPYGCARSTRQTRKRAGTAPGPFFETPDRLRRKEASVNNA